MIGGGTNIGGGITGGGPTIGGGTTGGTIGGIAGGNKGSSEIVVVVGDGGYDVVEFGLRVVVVISGVIERSVNVVLEK